MFLNYPGKRPAKEYIYPYALPDLDKSKNIFFNSDNSNVLRGLIKHYKAKIDLIYIDPPYSSNQSFTFDSEQISTISRPKNTHVAYEDKLLGKDFLEFLRERIVLLKELLSEKGSIYLHIDYKVGHYVKILMDEIFGQENFINDITRIKCNPKNFSRKGYGNMKDLILFYGKTNNYIWNDLSEDFSEDEINRLYKKMDANGNLYTTVPLHAPGETLDGPTGRKWRGVFPPKGRHWRYDPTKLEELADNGLIEWSSTGNPRLKVYAIDKEKSGKKIQDIWNFKDPAYPKYPTQKNLDLLKRIILNSSHLDSIVLDCFSGSGTTLAAAQMLGRKWIGIDKSEIAAQQMYQYFEELGLTIDFQFISQFTETKLELADA